MLRNEGAKRKNGARLFFASIILFATLLATASGVSLAKIFSSSSGGDNAQVSVMVVDLKGSSDNLTIDCGQGIATVSYNFAITNTKDGKTAELSFKYDVIVSLPEALPEGISITVDGTSGTLSSDRKTVTIADVGRFAAGKSQTREHTLVFSVVDESSLMKDYVFANTSISVRAEQIC